MTEKLQLICVISDQVREIIESVDSLPDSKTKLCWKTKLLEIQEDIKKLDQHLEVLFSVLPANPCSTPSGGLYSVVNQAFDLDLIRNNWLKLIKVIRDWSRESISSSSLGLTPQDCLEIRNRMAADIKENKETIIVENCTLVQAEALKKELSEIGFKTDIRKMKV